MLNTELLDRLYAGLSKEQQKKLTTLLFKKSKQTMNYFKRSKNISMSKLEILADFFHMKLDDFRIADSFSSNNVHAKCPQKVNFSHHNDSLTESQALQKELQMVKATLNAKDESLRRADETIRRADEALRRTDAIIQSKDEVIKVMSVMIEDLRAQIRSKQ